MAIHNESGTENIFLGNKMYQQMWTDRKTIVGFLKFYWKMVFQHARTSPH